MRVRTSNSPCSPTFVTHCVGFAARLCSPSGHPFARHWDRREFRDFSVVNALLLRPLPYPDCLAVLWLRSPGINIPQDWPSPGHFIDIQSENHSIEEMSISHGGTGTLLGLDQPERSKCCRLRPRCSICWERNRFMAAFCCRGTTSPGPAAAVVLSHEFWKRLFNFDPNIVGRSITLNGPAPAGQAPTRIISRSRASCVRNSCCATMPTVASGRSGSRSCARAANSCREISGSASRAIS
jgi:hypothetical protein